MSLLELSHLEKTSVQSFTEEIKNLDKAQFAHFTMTAPHGSGAYWSRFLKGAYNHPITWWIGIFQLQMQTGLWGHHYQAQANSRASELWQISKPLRSEASGWWLDGKDTPMLSAIIRYNLKHKKADIMGRMAGGKFTNYASTGGAMGKKRISSKYIKHSVAATNFTIASYGAAIKALTEGKASLDEVVQSILTGSADQLPKTYNYDKKIKPSETEKELLQGVESALDGVMSLSQIESSPVPIKEFCSRPENINIKGLCK